MAEVVNSYEAEREERIARNRKVMEALGLFAEDVELAAELRKKRESLKGAGGAKKRKAEEAQPLRRSRRLDGEATGEEAEPAPPSASAHAHEVEAEAYTRRHAGAQGRATLVGTASYEHTLMRCKTMSEAALLNRVKAIERSKGKHAVTKMRLFATVSFLEGYLEVSEAAAEALQRLIALLGEEEAEAEAEGEAS